jgi:HPt (histidine-containing phosphotransfer) domain-containing protein
VSDPIAAALRELRREYHAEGPARVAELERGLAALRAAEDGAETALAMLCHRLAGSGGAYGFPQVSTIARELERLLRSEPHWTPARLAELQAGIQDIADVFIRGSAD